MMSSMIFWSVENKVVDMFLELKKTTCFIGTIYEKSYKRYVRSWESGMSTFTPSATPSARISLWQQKKTTMNTTGGANVMGSYPYPPNGIVEIDYEFIHIFKKPGKARPVSKDIKDLSKLSKEEWKEYFSGHWYFGGAKQIEHEAMFPEKLPERLTRMFTYVGDTVFDPFLGSGTTAKVALELQSNTIGYQINEKFLQVIKQKLGIQDNDLFRCPNVQVIKRGKEVMKLPSIDYTPRI